MIQVIRDFPSPQTRIHWKAPSKSQGGAANAFPISSQQLASPKALQQADSGYPRQPRVNLLGQKHA